MHIYSTVTTSPVDFMLNNKCSIYFFSFSMKALSRVILFLKNIQGENVPPPFMTFEATGFPPEILREVCFLLSCAFVLALGLLYCSSLIFPHL
jgi:hypothetical protein